MIIILFDFCKVDLTEKVDSFLFFVFMKREISDRDPISKNLSERKKSMIFIDISDTTVKGGIIYVKNKISLKYHDEIKKGEEKVYLKVKNEVFLFKKSPKKPFSQERDEMNSTEIIVYENFCSRKNMYGLLVFMV